MEFYLFIHSFIHSFTPWFQCIWKRDSCIMQHHFHITWEVVRVNWHISTYCILLCSSTYYLCAVLFCWFINWWRFGSLPLSALACSVGQEKAINIQLYYQFTCADTIGWESNSSWIELGSNTKFTIFILLLNWTESTLNWLATNCNKFYFLG